MPAAMLCLTLLMSMLCKFTVRDVGFVFIGEPLVEVTDGRVRRLADGATLVLVGQEAVDGGAWRRALAQALLDSTAVIVTLPGDDAVRSAAAVQRASQDLEAMSKAGRLARPLDGPVIVVPLEVQADPVAAFALGWRPGAPPGAAVLYGRGRLAGPVLYGGQLDHDTLLNQLELVAESCECDRPRDWLHARHLSLPWDDDLRRRAIARLGFDPHSPRIKAEMERILARGPRGSTNGLVTTTEQPDGLLGYEEVLIVAPSQPAVSVLESQHVGEPEPAGFSQGLFWFCIALAIVVLVGVAMSQMNDKAA